MKSGRRRRRRRGRKTYTLAGLLEKQPKTLKRHPFYPSMMSQYHSSEKLQDLKINSTCYRLLDKAVISAENLPNMYRTYRVPKDPFFPLFLKIKLDYIEDRRRIKEERERFILSKVKELPPERRRIMRFLAEWEEELSGGRSRRCWEKAVYPGSKKKACELCGCSDSRWIGIYSEFIDLLQERYTLSPVTTGGIRASLTLQLIPGLNPLRLPGTDETKKAYRRLSRVYHPDSGGESLLFVAIGESREFLLRH